MDIPEPVKKYWPYGVGAIVGVYILVKMSGGSSSGGGSDLMAAQNAAASQNASLALASQAQTAQQNLARDKLAGETFIASMTAQGNTAQQLGIASKDIITSLQAPTIAAINASTAENIKTAESSVNSAIASYAANVENTRTATASALGYAQAMGDATRSLTTAINSSNASISQFQSAIKTPTPVAGSDYSGAVSGVVGLAGLALCDETTKENVTEAARDSLSEISQLDFVAFDYKPEFAAMSPADSFDVAIMAQQAQEINPTWVYKQDGFLMLHLTSMLFSSLHAIKQLESKVAFLEAQNG